MKKMHLQAMSGFKSWSLIRQSETPLVEVRLLIPHRCDLVCQDDEIIQYTILKNSYEVVQLIKEKEIDTKLNAYLRELGL